MKSSDRKSLPSFTQADWDEVSDNPDLTDEELAQLRPTTELPPAVRDALLGPEAGVSTRRGDEARSDARKIPLTLRLDAQVVEMFRATGPGWQMRINDILAEAVGLKPQTSRPAGIYCRPDGSTIAIGAAGELPPSPTAGASSSRKTRKRA